MFFFSITTLSLRFFWSELVEHGIICKMSLFSCKMSLFPLEKLLIDQSILFLESSSRQKRARIEHNLEGDWYTE